MGRLLTEPTFNVVFNVITMIFKPRKTIQKTPLSKITTKHSIDLGKQIISTASLLDVRVIANYFSSNLHWFGMEKNQNKYIKKERIYKKKYFSFTFLPSVLSSSKIIENTIFGTILGKNILLSD